MSEETCYDWCVHSTVIKGDKLYCDVHNTVVEPDQWCSMYVEAKDEEDE
jgi:hypothetical protein